MVISNKDNIISKNEIVEAESFLMLKPLFSHKKILIINKAEKLNYEAQSALLKSLEEPKSQFLIILVSSMPQRFLKTIKSRLLPIRFIKPKTDVLIDFLVKNYSTTKEQAAEAALLSLNQTGHAIKLITQKDFLIQTKENQKYFLKIHQRNFSKQVAVLDELIKKIESSPEKNEKTKTKKINQTQLKTVINDWLALVEKNLAETILNENQASNLSLKQQKTLLKNTLKLLYYLDNYNLNQKLLLDNFCLKTF